MMIRSTMRPGSAALPVVVALILAGCGGGSGESKTTAAANLCSSLAKYSAAVTELQGLGQQSTIADIETAATNVQTAYAQVEADAKDLKAAEGTMPSADALTSAQRNLQEAAKSLPPTTTVEQARTALQPELQALAQAYSQVYNDMKCS
jgi:hypothetical protein